MAGPGTVNNGHGHRGKRFPLPWMKAIEALLAAPHIDDAARMAGIAPRTLHRWLTLPKFTAEYQRRARLMFTNGTAQGKSSLGKAFTHLQELMEFAADDSSRVRACEVVLQYAFRAVELEDMSARLDRLEELAGQKAQGGTVVPLLAQITARMTALAPQAQQTLLPVNGIPPAPPPHPGAAGDVANGPGGDNLDHADNANVGQMDDNHRENMP